MSRVGVAALIAVVTASGCMSHAAAQSGERVSAVIAGAGLVALIAGGVLANQKSCDGPCGPDAALAVGGTVLFTLGAVGFLSFLVNDGAATN